MTIRHALILLAAAATCSCSDSASLNAPTAPTAALVGSVRGSAAATVETRRRVEDVEGGGNDCIAEVCFPYPGGLIQVKASGGTLDGRYRNGQQEQTDIYNFEPDSGLNASLVVTGSGRLDGINGEFFLSVTKDKATVLLQLNFPGGIQRIADSGVPTFRLEADAQCASGQRLTTSVELTLEYLGRTTVTDTHCTAINPTP